MGYRQQCDLIRWELIGKKTGTVKVTLTDEVFDKSYSDAVQEKVKKDLGNKDILIDMHFELGKHSVNLELVE